MINPELFAFHNFLPICLLVIFGCLIVYGIVVIVSKLIKAFLKVVIAFVILTVLAYGVYLFTEGKVKQARAGIERQDAIVEVQEGK